MIKKIIPTALPFFSTHRLTPSRYTLTYSTRMLFSG